MAELCTYLAVVPAVIQIEAAQVQIPPFLKLTEFNQPINPLHLLIIQLIVDCLLIPLLIVKSQLC